MTKLINSMNNDIAISNVHLLNSSTDLINRVDRLLEEGIMDDDLVMDILLYCQSVGHIALRDVMDCLQEYIAIAYCRDKYTCCYGRLPYRVRHNSMKLIYLLGRGLEQFVCSVAYRADENGSMRIVPPLRFLPAGNMSDGVNSFAMYTELESHVNSFIKRSDIEIEHYYTEWGYKGVQQVPDAYASWFQGWRAGQMQVFGRQREVIAQETIAQMARNINIEETYPRGYAADLDLRHLYQNQQEIVPMREGYLGQPLHIELPDSKELRDELARAANATRYIIQRSWEDIAFRGRGL